MNHLFVPNSGRVNLKDIVFDEKLSLKVDQFLREYEHVEILSQYGLPVMNKLLLHGKSGCGKTMTARALANHLGKKLKTINLGNIVSSKLGETSRNIAAAFKMVETQEAVLFFDEFDSLGKERDYDNSDSSEMKRVVNSMIQLIDSLPKNSIIIAATNQLGLIDEALIRRFELKLEFHNPDAKYLDELYDKLISKYPEEYQKVNRIYDISFAEAETIVMQEVKENIIKSELLKKEQKMQQDQLHIICEN
ncbi:ATP-binding protein [Labilibaculum sp. DW002]|uniref:ATP-binding protein n=1 Tax=Paralabilibaculum antarcticum TaxID=2912572 RepID=A0ABT5VTJ3_9BACT|nr:ATP-binding protein [Labilibaculum sp. DW002]MDE5418749.1 ATP-binding protein [Labilibaculum sp. DW002]